MQGHLGSSKDEPYLRTIPMGDYNIPPSFDHSSDVGHRCTGSLVLVGYGLVILVLDERISTYCYDSHLRFIWIGHAPPLLNVSSRP